MCDKSKPESTSTRNKDDAIVDLAVGLAISSHGGGHNLPLLLPVLRERAQEFHGEHDLVLRVHRLVGQFRDDPRYSALFAVQPPAKVPTPYIAAQAEVRLFRRGLLNAQKWLVEVSNWITKGSKRVKCELVILTRPRLIDEDCTVSTVSNRCDCTVLLQRVRVHCRNGILTLEEADSRCPNCLGSGHVRMLEERGRPGQ